MWAFDWAQLQNQLELLEKYILYEYFLLFFFDKDISYTLKMFLKVDYTFKVMNNFYNVSHILINLDSPII